MIVAVIAAGVVIGIIISRVRHKRRTGQWMDLG